MAELQVNIGNLRLKNPVMTASGTFGYGLEFQDFVPLEKLGGIDEWLDRHGCHSVQEIIGAVE